ncbi:MAG: radical SAM protein, partial [Polyangiaceae bacterium]|nr:radical SAM protein [Polyangiaceae bacterium]
MSQDSLTLAAPCTANPGSGAETYVRSTMAFCTDCNKTELARIIVRDAGVFMDRLCPKRGSISTRIAADPDWYAARTAVPRRAVSHRPCRPSTKGCPFDCGPCEWHTGGLHLPVFSITNECNLDCPICFTHNRSDRRYHKTVEETREIIGHIIDRAKCTTRSGGVQLINLTGGEPTLHPDLFAIIDACRHEGIARITVNTNGLRIAQSRELAERIKEARVQLVLSLDTFNPATSVLIHGRDIVAEKRKCLDVLEELDIPTTVLPVCIKGVNDHEIPAIVHDSLRRPFVRSVTVQNMTYTGKNGSVFTPREHITLDEVEALLSQRDGIERGDFFPLASYHPLCYSAAYYIAAGERMISLTQLLDRELLVEMSIDSYILDPKRDLSTTFRDAINRLWAEGADDASLAILRGFFAALYPTERRLNAPEQQEVVERWVKMVLIHPHMDEDNFDVDRASSCGDLVPDERGRMIPACTYNLL